jgi:hypothetical protein
MLPQFDNRLLLFAAKTLPTGEDRFDPVSLSSQLNLGGSGVMLNVVEK